MIKIVKYLTYLEEIYLKNVFFSFFVHKNVHYYNYLINIISKTSLKPYLHFQTTKKTAIYLLKTIQKQNNIMNHKNYL